jgi:NNP family nitrate/nitrite transporter-like MFS transporter
VSFAICFAAWGLVSAFAPAFRTRFHLSSTQTALLVAVPVLLGALARIPIGMLADRFGGRVIFGALMTIVAIPVALVPGAESFPALLVTAFLLGLAGSSFAVGVGYVSRWAPPDRQGSALGVYGLGNIGQSAAVFLGPVLAVSIGMAAVFQLVAALLFVWGLCFAIFARNAPAKAAPKGLGAMLRILVRSRLSWVLSLFYFLTFGGFVAFSIYLPTLLREEYGLKPADAGARAAGFVLLATLLRPVGGWLSDRIGGARVLSGVFLGIVPFAALLAWPSMLPFTVGALGCAALLGLGNGAVFKLVPQYFPAETGTVTGLVGAMGGLGGFFPPLLLGFCRDTLGATWPAFLLLAATAIALWAVNHRVLVPQQESLEATLSPVLLRAAARLRAGAWATLLTGILIAAIVVGSRNLQHFDTALVLYTFAVIFATWGTVYHYYVWIQKPPTRVFWLRGWSLFFERGALRGLTRVSSTAATHLVAQTFIRRRSRQRWWMHQFLFWGVLLAVAVTFPLVFGWIHFDSLPDDQMTYVANLFGFPVLSFPLGGPVAWLFFHALDISAVLVLAGISLALWRRMRDKGALALQSFAMDFLPLVLLFAISVTGLALTASTLWLRGNFYGFLAILHALTVIAALLYLPFGKFFHILQRPAQIGVKLYTRAGEAGEGALCLQCGERFASRMQVEDLRRVLPQVGFDYSLGGEQTWQDLCPACKRKALAAAQARLIREGAHG